jgi:trehalose utilization protein
MNVTIWNEYHPSAKSGKVNKIYPDGIHIALKNIFIDKPDINVVTATQEQSENGLTDSVLNTTDVLIWWGHMWHDNVLDTVVAKVCKRVLDGMGIIFLHSSFASKPFIKLMGTSCKLKWRDVDEKERLWIVNPSHPILAGIPETFTLEPEVMYGEYFDIPTPDELLLLGWYPGGEVIRSACTFRRGRGKVVYLQPGHETCPTFYNEHIKRLIINATEWAKPQIKPPASVKLTDDDSDNKPTSPVEAPKKGFLKNLFGRS